MGAQVQQVKTDLVTELTHLGHSVVRACELAAYPRASYYRHHISPARPMAPRIPQRDRYQPAALSDGERGQMLDELDSEEYADASISQVYYCELDKGRYIASRASWYRVARDHAMVGDRRAVAPAKARTIPHLSASGPGQVWSWDICSLKGPHIGQYWSLYVVIDIFSRFVTGWALHAYEDGQLANEMIDAASAIHGPPDRLHSDNGGPMISTPMRTLSKQLGIDLSYSRPKVSNDNPFSESLFKTYQYDLAFPERFETYEEALAYAQWFFNKYNNHHRHSGIAYHTPVNVHNQRTQAIDDIRQTALDEAWKAHPERFSTRPRPPQLPTHAHINPLSQTG